MLYKTKLTPGIALLLVHDLLLAKGGVAAPESHSLRVTVTRHRARLAAELTKVRLRRGFASIEGLRANLENNANKEEGLLHESVPEGASAERWIHPRWIRINTLRTTLDAQLKTTFDGYIPTDFIEEITKQDTNNAREKLIHIDRHIPNLVAVAPSTSLSKTDAYLNGLIIFQDKASCFPAYLLDPKRTEGGIIDACAAPGNKTTHLAMLLDSDTNNSNISQPTILACELDKGRSATLQAMITMAGAQNLVIVRAQQDFLKLNHQDGNIWLVKNQVGSLLLDPSCSGSGIVGRDKVVPLLVVFPEHSTSSSSTTTQTKSKSLKRKRKEAGKPTSRSNESIVVQEAENLLSNPAVPVAQKPFNNDEVETNPQLLKARLTALQTFQLELLLHAFTAFPTAHKIIYSTCSIHSEENEHVVLLALSSPLAKAGKWRVLRRKEQVDGARRWVIRGDRDAVVKGMGDVEKLQLDEVMDACIRCEKGTMEGTQGFFVAGFVRDQEVPNGEENRSKSAAIVVDDDDHERYESWEGITDEE